MERQRAADGEAPTSAGFLDRLRGGVDHADARPVAARWAFGGVVVVAGLFAVTCCLALALYAYRNVASASGSATAVATVLAPVTGMVGAVIGAYFGIQAGSAGTAAAQAATNEAQATAIDALTKLAAITAVTPAAASEQIHEILGVEATGPRPRTGF